MKKYFFILQIPMHILGIICATLIIGFIKGYKAGYTWWENLAEEISED